MVAGMVVEIEAVTLLRPFFYVSCPMRLFHFALFGVV